MLTILNIISLLYIIVSHFWNIKFENNEKETPKYVSNIYFMNIFLSIIIVI